MHLTGQFPNEIYLEGLHNNPDSTVAVLYDEFRQEVMQTIAAIGGSESDAARFFQIAVNDIAHLVRSGQSIPAIPLPDILQAFALAHYRDWVNEQGLPNLEPPEEQQIDLQPFGSLIAPDNLRKTRKKIVAWEHLQRLNLDCRKALQQVAPAEADAPESNEETERTRLCTEQYLKLISEGAESLTALPDWALIALQDTDGFAVWQRTQMLEHQWASRKPQAPESNRIWRWAIAALVLVAVGYGAYQFYFRPKTAAEVFADNFAPPSSLLEDLDSRYGAEMGNDSVSARPNKCIHLMQEADAYYRAKEYESALDPLLLIVLDSTSICQSDAWFFLGIIQLHLEDPATAIQCFAKIEDLNRYGEDLYWYQALAFVQLAKENPLMRDKARRAVERALGNTRAPQRRAQAEKMLKNLSQ